MSPRCPRGRATGRRAPSRVLSESIVRSQPRRDRKTFAVQIRTVKWKVRFSVHVEEDVAAAATWYEGKRTGLGAVFVDDVIQIWHELAVNPLLAARKHPVKNLRLRYPARFPYRIIYEVDEPFGGVLVLRLVHAARSETVWRA